MGVVKCSACGGMVSEMAATCPHCGQPMAKRCPKCGSTNLWYHDWGGYVQFDCRNCGYEWEIPYA